MDLPCPALSRGLSPEPAFQRCTLLPQHVLQTRRQNLANLARIHFFMCALCSPRRPSNAKAHQPRNSDSLHIDLQYCLSTPAPTTRLKQQPKVPRLTGLPPQICKNSSQAAARKIQLRCLKVHLPCPALSRVSFAPRRPSNKVHKGTNN